MLVNIYRFQFSHITFVGCLIVLCRKPFFCVVSIFVFVVVVVVVLGGGRGNL